MIFTRRSWYGVLEMKHERLIKGLIVAVLFVIVFVFGIMPLISGKSLTDYINRLSGEKYSFSEDEYAVIVVGSEPEGIAAAVAAARTGLKTLLLTGDSDLGSYIKRCMIAGIEPDEGQIEGRTVNLNTGIYSELFGKLKVGFTSNDYMKSVEKLTEQEKNLDILYGCRIDDVVLADSILKSIKVSAEGTQKTLSAGIFIDATEKGTLLELCNVPYTTGSEDIGLPDVYMPLGFNFMVSGVEWENMNRIQKASNLMEEFREVLKSYQPVNERTKIDNPTFVKQSDDSMVISAISQWGVDVDDPEDVKQAYEDAKEEAAYLTAYLKSSLTPFSDCRIEAVADELFIPEYRHYEGRYTLTVADILENRDFKNKIALASSPADAGKFVGNGLSYVITDPKVYAIPLGCIIPVNLDNVLMPGAKASFASLAATSAGSIPTRITMGQAAGLTAAWCYMGGIMPADILYLTDEETKTYEDYLKKGGIYLDDFSEYIEDPSTGQPLKDSWAYPYIAELAEYGLVAGGKNNDFRLDYESSCDVMAVLLKNAIARIAPASYSFKIGNLLEEYETTEKLTGEKAAAMVLDVLGISYESGEAFETAEKTDVFSRLPEEKLTKDAGVTIDTVYCLAVETAKALK